MEGEGPVYGKLNIVGKDGRSELAFPIDKKSILMGRDPSCDIRIVNKEISRKHAEVFVDDDTGVVFIMSMGREPVRVNGEPVTSPRELLTGDHIEVVLEGRTREFVFEGDDDTVEVPQARQPLGEVATNSAQPGAAFVGKKPGAPPPPPPPRARPPGAAPPPPPPPPPGRKVEAPAQPGMPSALQNAIKAGVKLKQVEAAPGPAFKANAAPSAAAPATAAAAFVPNPADLLKLRAGLRRTEKKEEAASLEEEAAAASAAQPKRVNQQENEQVEGVTSDGLDQQRPQAAAGASAQAAAAAAEARPDDSAALAAPQGEPSPMDAEGQLEDASVADRQQQGEAAADIEGVGPPAAEVEVVGVAAAAAGEAAAPTTAKKRVRFTMESSTPDGAAKDATMTIHLRKGGKRQIVNIDADNTVAFSQWALGSVEEEEAEEQLPATVTCKKSRRSSTLTAPSSAGKTPMHSALRSLFGENVSAVKLSPAPGSAMRGATPAGIRAPASTPLTGTKPTPARVPLVMDATTLAEKLIEIAKENDVTLELPAGTPVMPGSAAKEAFQVVVTPRSASKQATIPRTAPVPRSVANTASKSRLSQAGLAADGTPAVEPTEEVSFRTVALEADDTPVMGCASAKRSGRRTPASRSAASMPDALEVTTARNGTAKEAGELPAGAGPGSAPRSRTTPRVVIIERASTPSSARGRLVAAALADAVPATATAATPRSASRTPRVVIIESAATPASVRSSRGAGQATAGRSAAKAPAGTAGMQDAVLASPVDPIDIAPDGDGEEDGGEPVEQPEVEDQQAAGASHAQATGPQEPTVSLKQYQRVLLQAKAYRTQTVQLQAQLRRMTAKVVRLSKAASNVGEALEEERAKRTELQEAMQQIVLNREAAQAAAEAAASDEEQGQQGVVAMEQEQQVEVGAAADEVAAGMEIGGMASDQQVKDGGDVQMLEGEELPAASTHAPKVVVVAPRASNAEVGRSTERAGCVVVVRPPQAGYASGPAVSEVPPLATLKKTATATSGRVVVVTSAAKAPAVPATTPKAPGPTPSRVVVLASAVKAPATASKPNSSTVMPQVVVLPSPHKPASASSAEEVEVPAVLAQKPVPATTAKAQGAAAPGTSASALKSTGKTAGKSASRLILDNVQLPDWLFPAPGHEEGDQAMSSGTQADVAAVLAEAMEEVAAEAAVEGAAVEQAPEAAGELEADNVAMEEALEEAEIVAEPVAEEEEDEDDEDLVLDASCHVCGLSEEGDVLLLCDGCDGACHLTCCNPPLKRVPKGDWFCVDCVVKREAAAIASEEAARPAKKAHPAPQQAAKRPSKKQAMAPAAFEQEQADAASQEAAVPKPSGRGRRASVAPAPSQTASVLAAEPTVAAAKPGQQSTAASEEPHRGRPARGRQASVAPVSAPAAVVAASSEAEPATAAAAPASSAEGAAKTTGRRGRRASVVPAAAAPSQAHPAEEQQSEEPAAAAKPARGRRASLAAVPAQAGPKRGRGGAALNAIVEEEEEQEEGEQPATAKRQRAGANKGGASERTTAARTTRSRAAAPKDEEEREASTRKGARKPKTETFSAAPARVTRSRR